MSKTNQENLLEVVKNGPIFIAGTADDSTIEERIQALRGNHEQKSDSMGSCNMGWGWGN
jgi:hypothetical protein